MRLYFAIAMRNLLQARRRTILLSLALGFVACILMVMLGMSAGLREAMIDNATTLASGHVNVGGFFKSRKSDAMPIITKVSAVKQIVEENVTGVERIVLRDRAWAKLISPRSSLYISPTGIDIAEESRLLDVLKLSPQRDYQKGGGDQVLGNLGDLAKPRSALLFDDQAKQLEVEVGDDVTLTAQTGAGRTNTVDLTVVAIARNYGFMSGWSIFVPHDVVLELYGIAPDVSSAIMIYLDDPARAPQVMGSLRQVLGSQGYQLMDHEPSAFFMKFETVAGEDWTGQKLDLTTWEDEISYISWVSTAFDALFLFVVAILMMIIGVGIMNSMWIAVRERTSEIGTVRAIGMQRRGVLLIILAEAVLLGLIGSGLGAVCGGLIGFALDAAQIQITNEAMRLNLMSDTLRISISIAQIVKVTVAFTLFTALSAIWPALRAAKLEPVTAIQHAN